MSATSRIIAIHRTHMNVSLGPHVVGRIHITQVLDEPSDRHPFEDNKVGDILEARVIGITELSTFNEKYLPLTHQHTVGR
jgi:exosome complex RNA-binding protein Csl4